jgi:hypothetical protein
MNIKLSQSEWRRIGKNTGWLKAAQNNGSPLHSAAERVWKVYSRAAEIVKDSAIKFCMDKGSPEMAEKISSTNMDIGKGLEGQWNKDQDWAASQMKSNAEEELYAMFDGDENSLMSIMGREFGEFTRIMQPRKALKQAETELGFQIPN